MPPIITLLLIAVLSLVVRVLMQLPSMFRAVRAGKPFIPANAIRIRRIAYAVLAGKSDGQFLCTMACVTPPHIAIICRLVILVIAEIFREGDAAGRRTVAHHLHAAMAIRVELDQLSAWRPAGGETR
jgi:hypothetical protein